MKEENAVFDIRLKKLDERKNNFLEEMKRNELISKKRTKTFTNFNYVQHLLFSASTVTGCVSISDFFF